MTPFLLLFAFLSPFVDAPKAEKSDTDQIQGTWENVSGRFNGEDREPIDERMIVTDEFLKYQPEAPGSTCVYEIDPTSKPRRITMWAVLESGAQDKARHGIYKIEDDTLTLCINPFDDGRRPMKFSADKDDGNLLMVYRRVKPK
jgi:uncharacterized protein (TIGR03067 family)